ncbi:transcription factor GTE12-like [Olea europaea subsp. europaea]|uniref:Transcription factor GTE12-like n=1 Tax=Olea europaea subsp. europaea TaxID=158383 RepID=A0A8S0P779_OLEEU|nr:transcription factor GTE12-like [Olea europaea subsp. europaea]
MENLFQAIFPCQRQKTLNKHKPRAILECRREKRKRLNQSFKQQCTGILRSLMDHPHGFAFDQPVDDPVKLKIPDYFSIITEPMDLGTTKLKLEDNMYFDAGEFVSDISPTFSNAMLYNPPGKHVNNFAKELIDVLNQRWKLLETKLKCTGRNLEQLSNLDKIEKKRQDKKPKINKNGQNAKQSYLNRAVNGRPMLLKEKCDLCKELVKISKKARTAAKFRAAEAGLRMKAEAEAESKMQREREGEAARIAVEKVIFFFFLLVFFFNSWSCAILLLFALWYTKEI